MGAGTESVYLKLFEATSEYVAVFVDGCIVFCNPKMQELLGDSLDNIIGKHPLDFLESQPNVNGKSARELMNEKYRLTQLGESQRFEWRYVRRDGHVMFFDLHFIPIAAENQISVMLIGRDITYQKRAENSAREQQQLFRGVFDGIQERVLVLDKEMRVVFANHAFDRYLEQSGRPPIIGKICHEHIFDSDKPCEQCSVKETFRTGDSYRTSVYDEQENKWIEKISYPLLDDQTGEITGAIEFLRDITEQSRQQQELEKQEALLSAIINSIPDGIFIIDREYRILRANKAVFELYKDFLPLYGKKCYIKNKNCQLCDDCPAEKVFATGKSAYLEHYEPPAGSRPGVWVQHVAYPYFDPESGEITMAICLISNVTERKEFEQELRSSRDNLEEIVNKRTEELQFSERRIRSVLEGANTAIAILDAHGRYMYANTTFQQLFGYSEQEILGEEPQLISAADEHIRQNIRKAEADAAKNNQNSYRVEIPCRAKNGQIIWVDLNIAKIYDADGKIYQLVGVHHDITERRNMLKELSLAKETAESASLAKSQFLATMSHEIRTPLNGVLGLCDLLMRLPLGEKQTEYAQMIKSSGQTLLFLINDILDFSKIEAGKIELELESFDLHELISTVFGIVGNRVSERDLELCGSFGKGVPRRLFGDNGRIRQVILNLVGNALKFTEEGGVRVDVSLANEGYRPPRAESKSPVRYVKISVQDTGIGIPPDRMDRLFKLFSQADQSSSRIYGGTGLGLAISKRFIEMMGGEIGVESIFGSGSTFWFTLPVPDDWIPDVSTEKHFSFDDMPTESSHNRDRAFVISSVATPDNGPDEEGSAFDTGTFSAIRQDWEAKRALVVDDNPIQRETIIEQLQTWGMQAVGTTAGLTAFALLDEALRVGDPFQLLVVDSTLEDGNGGDWIASLRERAAFRNVPIVFLAPIADNTVFQQKEGERRTIARLNKPVFSSTLFDAAMILLSGERVKDERPRHQKTVQNVDSLPHKHFDTPVKILVAEDNRINQVVVREILKAAHFECDIVANGKEAVEAEATGKYDLILMDCQMPEIDGYEASVIIRNKELFALETEGQKAHIPIIALTANATKGDEERCLQSGMDAYCSKPIDPAFLIRTIHNWLDNTNEKQKI